MTIAAPDAPVGKFPIYFPQNDLILLVRFGCPVEEASYSAHLPTWLMEADFAEKFRAAVERGRNCLCSPEEAYQRAMDDLHAWLADV